jgi:chromosome segregation ATPase
MNNHSVGVLFAASAALVLTLSAAPASPDKLHESYVAGLTIIANTRAATTRMEHTLDLIDQGADAQTARVATMESRLFGVNQSIKQLEQRAQSLGPLTKDLLGRKSRIEARFAPLEHALKDDRTLLTKSIEAVAAVTASAEKSGSPIERSLAEEMTAEIKQHAASLRDVADQLAQSRQRISLESTLFEGLQPHLATAMTDLTNVTTDSTSASDRVAKQRANLKDLRDNLNRDRSSLAGPFAVFGTAVEDFRVVQIDVLRRWLLDGPPAGEIPALTIDEVVESGLPAPGRAYAATASDPNFMATGDSATSLSPFQINKKGGKTDENSAGNQISAEFTQLSRRARWCLAMLDRLESFADESLGEAEGWTSAAANWRTELTNINHAIADLRGTLASLQMEQDIVASTIKLIAKQAADTTGKVAATGRQIADQTTQLKNLTAELKRLSAN